MTDSENLPATIQDQIKTLQKFDDSIFEQASQAGDWLPRLQLMTANSELCKAGKFPINEFAIIKGSTHISLGKELDVVAVSWRPKALDMGEKVIAVYDVNNEEFKRIMKASENPNSGCMFGPEFLLWIPSLNQYATFYMGSKSARIESPNLKASMTMSSTLRPHLIAPKGSKHTWFAPQVHPCSVVYDIADQEALFEQITKFQNPPETSVEAAEDSPSDPGSQRAV